MRNSNQMADTFFDFSTLKNGEHILPPDDDELLENEEEYDALNDETFGDSEDALCSDDWEQQHEQYAKGSTEIFTELESKMKNTLRDLVFEDIKDILEPLPLTGNSVWSYTPPPSKKNGDISILSSLQRASQTFVQTRLERENTLHGNSPRICTVEELEKNLMKPVGVRNSPCLQPSLPPRFQPQFPRNVGQGPPQQMYPPRPQMFQHPYPMGRFPPPRVPPPMMNMPPIRHNLPPPGFRMMHHPPHPFLQQQHQQRPPPGMPGNPYPVYHHMPLMPPMQPNHRNINYQFHQKAAAAAAQQRFDNEFKQNQHFRDEYEGLMTSREKQWLLNIQMVQLNTGTPYFDDYYYTVFKERKAKNEKENSSNMSNFEFPKFRQRRNSERQENPMMSRVYTPLQFENSLGKLQCMSVTAPRKIIDTDVVSCEKDAENMSITSRDMRKTKQFLLELEMMYTLLLKAEDLTNPIAINNLKVLRDIKQKQRFKELELAVTSEQKQEILELVKRESEPQLENPNDYLAKILAALLGDEKFASYMSIRKGKLLLLRLIPTIAEHFFEQLIEIWSKLLSSLAIIGRRDTLSDNLLPKFYPLFKRYIQSVKMEDILENIRALTECHKLENSRSTPLSHQGRQPLYFVLMNKFGISAMTALFVRCEYLISTGGATEKQQEIWFSFILNIGELIGQLPKVPYPLEGISASTFAKICQRIPNMSTDKKTLLNKYFVEVED